MGVYKFEDDRNWPSEVILSSMTEGLDEPDPEAIDISNQIIWNGPGTMWLEFILFSSLVFVFYYLTFGWPKLKDTKG